LSTPDVVLLGYFGRGNFGDDILMVVAHALAQQMLPGAQIALRIGSSTNYPEKLLGPGISRIPFGTRDRHRLVLHGGGGTFFDFATHGRLHRFANALMLSAGTRTLVQIEGAIRQIVGRQRLSARTRLGLGLGIGTFTPGSPKLRDALPVLADFDALWLRDADSVANLARLGVSPPVVRGSDLAFLWEHWCPPELALARSRQKTARPRVGVILRDWPVGSGISFAQDFAPVLERLSKHYELTLISLDPETDSGTLTALLHLPHVVWRPEQTSIGEFVKEIAEQDVLLTSRAHGAICGACVGRSSVILGIEPKLKAVHAMLPEATRIVMPPYRKDAVICKIEEALAISLDSVAADAQRNRSESQSAMNSLLERLNP
jgi:polysaccharide pyruvyl transferase WcaK-like protein